MIPDSVALEVMDTYKFNLTCSFQLYFKIICLCGTHICDFANFARKRHAKFDQAAKINMAGKGMKAKNGGWIRHMRTSNGVHQVGVFTEITRIPIQ